jgi:hypothetical protein
LSFGPDALYVTASALQLKFTRVRKISEHAPFHVLRIPTKHLKSKALLRNKKFSLPAAGQ